MPDRINGSFTGCSDESAPTGTGTSGQRRRGGPRGDTPMTAYAELHCLSNFSFLRGASHPQELVRQAAELGYSALALTDECSLAGIVRAHQQAQELHFKLIIGTEILCTDGPKVVLLAPDQTAYSQLCRLITRGRRQAEKGQYQLSMAELSSGLDACLAILIPHPQGTAAIWLEQAHWLKHSFAERGWLAVELHRGPQDSEHLQALQTIGRRTALKLVACGDVHMHLRQRRRLQDTLTAIRHGCTMATVSPFLFPNGERHLRKPATLERLYPPELLRESQHIAARCQFSLDELHYRYPAESVPPGQTAAAYLRALTEQGLSRRWPQGVPAQIRPLIDKELALITELEYEHYFLTVFEIVSWARAQGILCQGRGSAANSAVCYALGITAVDPVEMKVSPLFERFISRERNEPPDIDVDFEHHRREEVMQHIYRKYGRERAAIAATVIRYKPKSAIRDVGKALGLALQDVSRISQSLAWWDSRDELPERLRDLGFDPETPVLRHLLSLIDDVLGFPRHLSQHVGGFVIAEQALDELVPIENAAMSDRTILQWDKDDLDALGLLKIDCLALGMLSAIRKAFAMIRLHTGKSLSIERIRSTETTAPDQARQVYAMLQRADTVGVFQVESRAQMSMLPRLKPREFYDLVIETAIVRPGPIQGGMVHPYLNRRMGREPILYPARLKSVLERTLGIPIFQEQVMEICVKAGDFSPGEADQVRRSMAAWRRTGSLDQFETRLKAGMRNNGYDAQFAEQIYKQIQGFAEYGFPESHAASFAVLVYVSAWLKCFEPAAFLAGLLNSQPMGFYSASQLIQDARRHGVEVRAADVSFSTWDCRLEKPPGRAAAVRLGLRQIKGLSEACGRRIEHHQTYADVQELIEKAALNERERQLLAQAGALRSLAGNRHQAHWQAMGSETPHGLLNSPAPEQRARLRPPDSGENLCADYASLGYTLGRHPMSLLRPLLPELQGLTARQWRQLQNGSRCRVAGLVTNRQRPGTAGGVIFMSLEDETGSINLIVTPAILARFRQEVLQGSLLLAQGMMENRDGVQHLLVDALEDRSALLGELRTRSRDFH